MLLNQFPLFINPWWHISGSTLAQVMAWCLKAPSHYLTQYWFIISKWVSLTTTWLPEGIFKKHTSSFNHKITLKLKFHWNPPGANELMFRITVGTPYNTNVGVQKIPDRAIWKPVVAKRNNTNPWSCSKPQILVTRDSRQVQNLLHEFWEPWPNRAILEPVIYGAVL